MVQGGAKLDRRRFLAGAPGVAALAAGAATMSMPVSASDAADKGAAQAVAMPDVPAGYQSLSADEAIFVEALVDLMCPADDLTPGGTECGIATYIDRQIAGSFGHNYRLYTSGPWLAAPAETGYQLPLSRDEWFKAGIAAAQSRCRAATTRSFDQLAPAQQDEFLSKLATGTFDDDRFALGVWFNELVYPLFVQGCFADPIYGGNRDKVFWKLIGYPGLPATNSTNVVTLKGKPVPGAANPKSIQDFS